jgi:hypothetical protein
VLRVSYAEKVSLLISRRFPDAWKLEGATNPRAEELQQYKRELADLTESALDDRYVPAVEEQTREKEQSEEQADRLQFFNQPDAAADFRYWCTLKSWTLGEATALLFGKDPRKVSRLTLHRLKTTSPFAQRFDKLSSQFFRAKDDGAVKDCDSPYHLVDWALSAGISVPADLISVLKTTEMGSGPAMEGRERASLLKLVLGMAMRHYAFDPTVAKSGAAKQIADDLAATGHELTPETVRKFLREAVGLLAPKTNKKELW